MFSFEWEIDDEFENEIQRQSIVHRRYQYMRITVVDEDHIIRWYGFEDFSSYVEVVHINTTCHIKYGRCLI